MSEIEIIKEIKDKKIDIKVVLFDFDGTISTLRQGWEKIMEPLMIESICGEREPEPWLIEVVQEYIDQSTGIQTIYQMKWLSEKVKEYGFNSKVMGPWEYKEEYNNRLLLQVNKRLKKIRDGELDKDDFIIKGSLDFLKRLKKSGYQLFLASGTDHPDVINEAEILGVKKYFNQIAGAPVDRIDSSKKAVIKELLEKEGLSGDQILIIGDGKVEISIGIENGIYTLGMATDELNREGINDWKREKLIKAGADAITGDFKDFENILSWLNMS